LLRAILLLLIVSNRASAVTDDIHDFSEALSLVQSSKSNHSPCMEKAIESYFEHRKSATSELCMGMTESDSHALAFMLSACHYAEAGRKLKGNRGKLLTSNCDVVPDKTNLSQSATQSLITSEESAESCISLMTDTEFQIYTQFKVHVFTICDKLTSNHWRKVTSNHIEALTKSASSVSASLADSLSKHDHLIRKSDELRTTLVDSHRKTIDTMETSHKESITRAEEIREAQESMRRTVQDTTLTLDSMRQSVDFIESFASRAWVYGQKMATFSHFLALINAAFVLTSTEVTKSARAKLFAVASANAVLEYITWWAVDREKVSRWKGWNERWENSSNPSPNRYNNNFTLFSRPRSTSSSTMS